MATETTNYHFIKPDDDDPVDNTPLNQNFDRIDEIIAGHVADTNNPHQVTKEQVGLGNVDNVATKDVLAELVDSGAKNLLKNTATSQIINGVIFTVNADKSVTVSGTATSNITTFFLSRGAPALTGNMVLSGCPAGGSYDTYRLDILDGRDSGTVLFADYGEGTNVDWSLITTGKYTVRIRIGVGTTVDGLIFKPMLCTVEDYAISPKFIPHRPSYDELIARVEALEQAAGINTRSVATLTTESAADTTETEGGEVR